MSVANRNAHQGMAATYQKYQPVVASNGAVAARWCYHYAISEGAPKIAKRIWLYLLYLSGRKKSAKRF